MPITIRELIASDTISQAVDKINFNFDQLLLNGGGPRGPVGPAGPIGPIGGRGIRGSVWYEGLNSPLATPPTLTPEDQDNYLQANGDVWTYSESGGTWVLTGVNLTGPVGPAGASGKFSDYRVFPYDVAGDTTIYPTSMTLSGDSVNRSVKAVIVGGLPGNIAGNPASGIEVIDASLAQTLVQPAVSLFVHQFTGGSGSIKFHGGDPLGTFSNLITELSEIRLANDDCMVISAPKVATSYSSVGAADGLRVLTQHRNQLFQAGKRITFQTGASSQGGGLGDTNDFIVEADRNGGGSVPTIQLNVLADDTAELRLGGISSPIGTKTGVFWANAGAITLQGSASITGNAPIITLNGSTGTNIFAGGTSIGPTLGHVKIGASQQVSIFTQNGSANGAIGILTGNGTPGNIVIGTGAASTGGIAITTQLGTGDVNLISGDDVNVIANDAITMATDTGSTGNITITTAAGTGQLNLSSAAAGTVPGAINISTAGATAGNINLITAPSSPGSIVMLTGANSTGGISILTSAGATGSILISNSFGSAGDITITAADDISIRHGAGSDSITLGPNVSSAARIYVRPFGAGTRSDIVVSSDPAGTGNLLLRSDASATGEIVVDAGMDLELNAGAAGTDHVRVIAGNTAPTAGSDDPRFAVSAANHYTDHTSRIVTAPANINIIASGRFVSTTTTTARTLQLNWMRVGNVVNCTGVILTGAALPASEIVPLPIGTALSSSVRGVWSTTSVSGTINDSSGTAADFQNPTGITTNLFFSFSYVIA